MIILEPIQAISRSHHLHPSPTKSRGILRDFIKTEDEVECLRMAYSIGERAVHALDEAIAPGVKESDLVGAVGRQ